VICPSSMSRSGGGGERDDDNVGNESELTTARGAVEEQAEGALDTKPDTNNATLVDDQAKEDEDWPSAMGTAMAEVGERPARTLKVLIRRKHHHRTLSSAISVAGTTKAHQNGHPDDNRNSNVRHKSVTDRERDYAAARARIFGNGVKVANDQVLADGDANVLVIVEDDTGTVVLGESDAAKQQSSRPNDDHAKYQTDGSSGDLGCGVSWARQALTAAAREPSSTASNLWSQPSVATCVGPGGVVVARGPSDSGIGFESRKQRFIELDMRSIHDAEDSAKTRSRSLWRNRLTDANDPDFNREGYLSGPSDSTVTGRLVGKYSQLLPRHPGSSAACDSAASGYTRDAITTAGAASPANVKTPTFSTLPLQRGECAGWGASGTQLDVALYPTGHNRQLQFQSSESSPPPQLHVQVCTYTQQPTTPPVHHPDTSEGGPKSHGLGRCRQLPVRLTQAVPPPATYPMYHTSRPHYNAYGFSAAPVRPLGYMSQPFITPYGYPAYHAHYPSFLSKYSDTHGSHVQVPIDFAHQPRQCYNNHSENQQRHQRSSTVRGVAHPSPASAGVIPGSPVAGISAAMVTTFTAQSRHMPANGGIMSRAPVAHNHNQTYNARAAYCAEVSSCSPSNTAIRTEQVDQALAQSHTPMVYGKPNCDNSSSDNHEESPPHSDTGDPDSLNEANACHDADSGCHRARGKLEHASIYDHSCVVGSGSRRAGMLSSSAPPSTPAYRTYEEEFPSLGT